MQMRLFLFNALALPFFIVSILAAQPLPQYSVGDPIPVSCLNRYVDTGEHVADGDGKLEYLPFPSCKETGKPLELFFGKESEFNCTIDFVDEKFFRLLEYYVHNDVPLTCRIPFRPLAQNSPSIQKATFTPEEAIGVLGSESSAYIPMVIALSGVLQLSHLHVANNLNVLLHAAPRHSDPGVINSAIAYSTSHASRNVRVVIGDSLPLRLSVRWYPNPSLPSGWQGVGGHLTGTTLLYCLLCAGASAAVCTAYFRGIELPRRLRTHGRDRIGVFGAGNQRGAGGYGLMNNSGFTGVVSTGSGGGGYGLGFSSMYSSGGSSTSTSTGGYGFGGGGPSANSGPGKFD